MSDALRRSIRTFVQAFAGSLLTSNALSVINTNGVVDWDVLEKVVISAVAAGVIAVLTFVVNFLEDNTRFPALLKAQASSGVNPVTVDPAPAKKKPAAKKPAKKKAAAKK